MTGLARLPMVTICAVNAALLLAGCGASVAITQKAPGTDRPAVLSPPNPGPTPRAVIEAVAFKQNLVSRDAEPRLTQDFIAGAQGAGLFSEINANRDSRNHMRDVGITLSINETLDTHGDENQMRRERIEKSYILPIFTPFLIMYHRFQGDFESQMLVHVERWDGETRQYTALARGRMEYSYNADPEPSQQELVRQVTANVIQSLINQMTQDRSFFVAPAAGGRVTGK